jgi:hypothetical protein
MANPPTSSLLITQPISADLLVIPIDEFLPNGYGLDSGIPNFIDTNMYK